MVARIFLTAIVCPENRVMCTLEPQEPNICNGHVHDRARLKASLSTLFTRRALLTLRQANFVGPSGYTSSRERHERLLRPLMYS